MFGAVSSFVDMKTVQLEKLCSGTEKHGGFDPWIRNQVIPGMGGAVPELDLA
jgi:hypothetical protein